MKNDILSEHRLIVFDIYKGFGIILVLIGHTFWNEWISSVIFSFHLPMFFLFTGYSISNSVNKYSFKEYFQRKFDSILKPYFVALIFFLSTFFLYDGFNNFMTPVQRFWGIFEVIKYSSSYVLGSNYFSIYLWFLPTFFLFTLSLFIIFKKFKKYLPIVFLIMIVISSILIFQSTGKYYQSEKILWGVDKIPLMLATGIIGYIFYKKQVSIDKLIPRIFPILIFITVFVAGFFKFDFRVLLYPSILHYFLFTISGSLIVYWISKLIENYDGDPIRNFLVYCGKNTLGIYITHSFVYYWIHSAMGSPVDFHLIYNLSAVILSIAVYRIIQTINAYLRN